MTLRLGTPAWSDSEGQGNLLIQLDIFSCGNLHIQGCLSSVNSLERNTFHTGLSLSTGTTEVAIQGYVSVICSGIMIGCFTDTLMSDWKFHEQISPEDKP